MQLKLIHCGKVYVGLINHFDIKPNQFPGDKDRDVREARSRADRYEHEIKKVSLKLDCLAQLTHRSGRMRGRATRTHSSA